MKKNWYFILVLALGFVGLQSCSDDDDDDVKVTTAVREAFNAKFPNATRVDWEMKHNYFVADFWENGVEYDAWFSQDTELKMLESDVRGVESLPEPVLNAFKATSYTEWRVDDIDKYERGTEVFYLIEIEKKGEKDRKLFYSPEGTLLKDVEDAPNDDILPTTPIV